MLRGYVWWDTQDPQWPGWTLDTIPAQGEDRERHQLYAHNWMNDAEAQEEAASVLICTPQEIGVAYDDAEAAEMRDHPERW